MNDRNHSDLNASSEGPQEKHETLVLFEKLQELRSGLRKVGVVRVLAAYEKNSLTLAFLNSEMSPILLPNLDEVVDELSRLLELVVKRRYPVATLRQANGGSFAWHLEDDILIHKHTVTFRGLP
jgi:hypothetical protein